MNTNNKYLKNYLEVLFNKPLNEIKKADLDLVRSVSLEGDYDENNNYRIDLRDISMLPNIDTLFISNAFLVIDDIKILIENNIKKLSLLNCTIDNEDNFCLIKELETLELINCFNDSFDFLKNMERLNKLSIINPINKAPININDINNTIKELVLERCNIINFQSIENKNSIISLDILWSDLDTDILPFINKIDSLKELCTNDNIDLINLKSDIIVKRDHIADIFDEELRL